MLAVIDAIIDNAHGLNDNVRYHVTRALCISYVTSMHTHQHVHYTVYTVQYIHGTLYSVQYTFHSV